MTKLVTPSNLAERPENFDLEDMRDFYIVMFCMYVLEKAISNNFQF